MRKFLVLILATTLVACGAPKEEDEESGFGDIGGGGGGSSSKTSTIVTDYSVCDWDTPPDMNIYNQKWQVEEEYQSSGNNKILRTSELEFHGFTTELTVRCKSGILSQWVSVSSIADMREDTFVLQDNVRETKNLRLDDEDVPCTAELKATSAEFKLEGSCLVIKSGGQTMRWVAD